jgi:transposase
MPLARYALTDQQWEKIADKLPGRAGSVGVTAKDNRLFVDAVLYKFRAGIPWRDLPARFGPWHPVYQRFNRWSKAGIWQNLFEQLSRVPDNEYALIDATIVRAHRSASGALKKGQAPNSRSRTRRSGEVAADWVARSTRSVTLKEDQRPSS